MDLARELSARFGPQGVRRFDGAELGGLGVDDRTGALLCHLGLPLQVGQYFRASAYGDPVALGAYTRADGIDVGPAMGSLPRLGGDGGAQLFVAPDRTVHSLLAGIDDAPRLVSSSPEAFLACLLTLHDHLPRLAQRGELPQVAGVYKELRTRLLQLDERAVTTPEAWWTLVLEDIRHAMSCSYSAAVKFLDRSGSPAILTTEVSVAGQHPEERLYQQLSGSGIPLSQVTEVYCELQPCLMPGHYCSLWLGRAFPNAAFTHSFDFQGDEAQRQESVVALLRHAASAGAR